VPIPPHLIPEEPNLTAWVRVILYTLCLLPYLRYWIGFERTPGNGGKFVIRMLLIPFVCFLFLAMIVALGKAADFAENLQVLLLIPGLVGVICLVAIERHHREVRK
jgi:hypothetical protein